MQQPSAEKVEKLRQALAEYESGEHAGEQLEGLRRTRVSGSFRRFNHQRHGHAVLRRVPRHDAVSE